VLGEDELPIHHDVENAAGPLDQPGARTEFLFELGRQTGGPGLVISGHTEGDLDVHRSLPIAHPGGFANTRLNRGISKPMSRAESTHAAPAPAAVQGAPTFSATQPAPKPPIGASPENSQMYSETARPRKWSGAVV
jgi:hypothetical protein